MCVCLSVCLSGTTGYEVAKERYQPPERYVGMVFIKAIFLKLLHSRDNYGVKHERKSHYANDLNSLPTAFVHFRDHEARQLQCFAEMRTSEWRALLLNTFGCDVTESDRRHVYL